MRIAIAIVGLLLAAGTLPAADKYKDGWTPPELAKATDECTDGLVQGAWENTKKAQHVDPAMEMTPEIRKQLEPQIKAMRGLCDCAVKQAAQKYTKADADKPETDVATFTADVIKSGKCKLAE